ncbi:MAG: hypothetical protein H6824_15380 [Planctomycetaceae bacterium]|nr:hypothetical protein [Planctomycetaceae bacterium]
MPASRTALCCLLLLQVSNLASAEESIRAHEIVQRWLDHAEKTPMLRAEFLTVEKGSLSEGALPPILFVRGGARPLFVQDLNDEVGEAKSLGDARIFHGIVTLENFHWRTETWGERAIHGAETSELHLVRIANRTDRIDFWDWKDESQQSVGVRGKDKNEPAKADEIRTWMLLFRPQVSVELAGVLDQLTVTESRRSIDGEECLCLEQETPDRSANSVRVWVSPNKDFRIVALQQRKNDQLVRDVHVKYREHADLGFVPDSWEITEYAFALPPGIALPELPNLDPPEFPDVPVIEVLTPIQKQVDPAPVPEVPVVQPNEGEDTRPAQAENSSTPPPAPKVVRSSKTRVTSINTEFQTDDEFWELTFPEGVFQIDSERPVIFF